MGVAESLIHRFEKEPGNLEKLPDAQSFRAETGRRAAEVRTGEVNDKTKTVSELKLKALLEVLNSSHQESA